MKNLLLSTFWLTISAIGIFAQAKNTESIYTGLSESDCQTIEQSDEDAGWYRGICPGVGGYKLELLESDIRQTINVISPDGKKSELELWSVVSGGFSSVGNKTEWRVTRSGPKITPLALIVRYNVQNPATEKTESFLAVIKITKSETCVTDIVKPVANQNVKARQLADTSAKKPCKAAQ
jgi:hypothetical protein